MENREHRDSRLYYSISEVAELVQEGTSTLRYWEKRFPKLKPSKSTGGHRQYTAQDVDLIREIKHLLHVEGVSIEQANCRLGQMGQREQNRMVALSRLLRLQSMLRELRDRL